MIYIIYYQYVTPGSIYYFQQGSGFEVLQQIQNVNTIMNNILLKY